MKKLAISVKNVNVKRVATFSVALAISMGMAKMGYCDDLFADGKDVIKENVGADSTANFTILVWGLLGATFVGLTSRNWTAAIVSFVVLLIFFTLGGDIVGLN